MTVIGPFKRKTQIGECHRSFQNTFLPFPSKKKASCFTQPKQGNSYIAWLFELQLITTLSTNQSLERWNKPPWLFSNFIIRGSPTSTSSMTYVSSWPFSKLLWNQFSKTTDLVRALVPRKRVIDFHHIQYSFSVQTSFVLVKRIGSKIKNSARKIVRRCLLISEPTCEKP